MTTLPACDTIGLLIYQWDATTDLDRTDTHYLQAAGLIVSAAHAVPELRGRWGLDDVWELMDLVSLWDACSCSEERSRSEYLELAELVIAGPGHA